MHCDAIVISNEILQRVKLEIALLRLNKREIAWSKKKMISKILIPASPFIKLKNGEKCSIHQRIKTESACKDATKELSLNWGSSYTDPSDLPGCYLYKDEQTNEVFFNTDINARGSDVDNTYEICDTSKTYH